MFETKITVSLRLRREDQDFIKGIGHDSFTKGFEKILKFFKENKNKVEMESYENKSSKEILEELSAHIKEMEKRYGNNDNYSDRINKYHMDYAELSRHFEEEEIGKKFNVLKGRFGNLRN